MKKTLLALAVVAGASLGPFGVSAAHADGPKLEVFDANDSTWACAGDQGVELPPNHCLNAKSQGKTGLILVFSPDPRWPQESISFDPKADSRPCPHDPAALDGTWWSPFPGAYVCHHRP
jgi:hypothetical protein